MASIGVVRRKKDGSFEGQLKTLSVQAALQIIPMKNKSSEKAPDYRVLGNGVEIGAGWKKIGQQSGEEYISLSMSAPELGKKPLYANLGKAAGQDEEDVYSLIWNG